MNPGQPPAFTLLELMVVIAIAAMLTIAAVPAFNAITRGSQLTQAGQLLTDELALARQAALTRNRAVEVRLYRCPARDARHYRAIQSFVIDDDTGRAVATGRARFLPAGVIIDAGSELSPLLQPERAKTAWTDADPQLPLPDLGTDYDARVFRFQSDGTTNLTITAQWFLTLHHATLGDNLGALPNNYYVIQINPLNGSVQTYRP
ncbi:MAG: Verru_Chthon cassette protein D [Verrucomicrobiales bacterium]|jgi:uncharacterized protein (TIGR02596 family)|nr:Verru_Chthon cassette protein D [Verrucomicrobiales bacterium]